MKKLLPLLVCALLTLDGCKRKNVTPKLSVKIQRIISTPILNSLKAKGLIVNEGATPPDIGGVYQASPYRLLSPYGPDDNYAKGRIINDYKYRFYDQKGDDVKLDFKNTGSDQGTGVSSFLAGSGNRFSLFGEQTGVSDGISYKSVSVISGEVTATGIKDFQYAFVLTEKGPDPTDKLIAVGQGRVWEDGNALADRVGSYRLAAGTLTAQAPGGSLKSR